MTFTLTEEQQLLKDSARDFCAEQAPVTRFRKMRDDKQNGRDPALWAEMAALGWTGVIIPEEFGGLGLPPELPAEAKEIRTKLDWRQPEEANTTIAIIATDAVLTKAEAKRLAVAAHDGLAHAIWPSHTPLDGDLVFALATGASGKRLDMADFIALCTTPELAAEVTLQPIRRYRFDAAILFSDILMVPWALGQGLAYHAGEGPVLPPLRNAADVAALAPARSCLPLV